MGVRDRFFRSSDVCRKSWLLSVGFLSLSAYLAAPVLPTPAGGIVTEDRNRFLEKTLLFVRRVPLLIDLPAPSPPVRRVPYFVLPFNPAPPLPSGSRYYYLCPL